MFRAISSHTRAPLRSLAQTLTFLPLPALCSVPSPSLFKIPIDRSRSSPLNPPCLLLSVHSSPFSQSPLLQRHEDAHADERNRDPTATPRLFVVQPRLRPESILQAKLDEALSLANSLEEQRDGFFDTEIWEKELPAHAVVQNPAARSPRADTYFGPGTVDTVKCHLNAAESEGGVDAVFVNAILTGIQQRNLERAWGKPVLDRVGLIIEIFDAHAYTKEAKLQAELAALMYKRSRLVRVRGPGGRYAFGADGEAEVVSARGRGSGGRGFISGAGETELQLQRRRILERRKQLLSEIEEVRRTRALQRAARRRHGGENGQAMATVAVVGYTNAGKSTLVSALSNSDLYSDDRLFATVDPKLRSVILPSGRKVLVSDTVGFISDLPVQLVEAFHATLEEVVEADLLVHVLDSSARNLEEHRETVLQVLKQIGVSQEKLDSMIEVWNKIDIEEEMDADQYLDNGKAEENSNCSGGEDNDGAYGQACGELVEENDEGMDGLENDNSDSWLQSGDEHDILNEMGWVTGDEPQNMSSEDWSKSEKKSNSRSPSVPPVKTSAITGVGLQELLEMIDESLKSENVVERNVFDRKWRPPRAVDSDAAVEQ